MSDVAPPSPGGALTLGIASALRQQILDGRWPTGSRLPPDGAFARQLQVGTSTVRRALALLAEEGLVERQRGSGTVVVADALPVAHLGPTVGLLVPTERHYFPSLIAGVEHAVQGDGGRVLVRRSQHSSVRDSMIIDELVELAVDGLVLAPNQVNMADHVFLERLETLGTPVVLAERSPYATPRREPPHSLLSSVVSDVRRGGLVAVHHLVETGRTAIGLLSSRDTATSESFHAGFMQAAHELELIIKPSAIMRWRFGWERRQRWARTVRWYVSSMIEAGIDAVVCFDNLLAVQLLREFAAAGIRVPDDVAVVVYDDAGPQPAIPLTAVLPPRYEVGRLAAQMVVRQVETGLRTPTTHTVVAPDLEIRSSTAPAPVRRVSS